MKMPNSVCWNITRYCNDTCRFCYRDKVSQVAPRGANTPPLGAEKTS